MTDTPVTWLAIREDQKAFEDQQLRALRAAFPDLVEASPAQLGIFFHYCKASGLDPFGRQIYMIKRKSRGEIRWTIQTGIDGYRLIARRAADRAGQSIAYEDFVWYDAEGGEHTVWLRDEPPAACRVVVWRGDSRFPAVAHWREYAPKVWDYEAQEYKLGGLWPQMPASQLSKVAEALALRRACPADLSGLHVDEEMHAADVAEFRESVKAAVARLRPAKEQAQRPEESSTGQSDTGVVDGELVESAEPSSDAEAGTAGEAQRAPDDAESSAAIGSAEDRTASVKNERDQLEEARIRVQKAAQQLGLGFDAVNDRCFDDFEVSFQDASAEQLGELADALTSTAETSDGSPDGTSASEAPVRRKGPARKAATKTAKKTVAAKKAIARATKPRGTSARAAK